MHTTRDTVEHIKNEKIKEETNKVLPRLLDQKTMSKIRNKDKQNLDNTGKFLNRSRRPTLLEKYKWQQKPRTNVANQRKQKLSHVDKIPNNDQQSKLPSLY